MNAKKTIKIVLLSFVSLIGTLVLATAIAALSMVLLTKFYDDGSRAPEAQNGLSLDNWMMAIEDDTLLSNVAIPGAHDAGCIDMMWAYQTQNVPVADQLHMGVRYFDLRIANDNGTCRIFHADLMGIEAEGVILAIREWLIAHPTEGVILDFQHFLASESVSGSEDAAYDLVCKQLQDLAVVNQTAHDDLTFVKGLTMADMRGKCLVLWGNDDFICQNNWVFLRDNDEGTRANSVLHSYYKTEYNTKPSMTYIQDYLPLYWAQFAQSEGGLFVLQGQLTDRLYVFGPALQESKHDENMDDYVAHLPDEKVAAANIIMRDYVTPGKSMVTIRLNIKKSVVKQEYAQIISSWQ